MATLFGEGLVWPDYGGACITQLGPLAGRCLGVGEAGVGIALAEERRYRRVVLVILDALGYEATQHFAERVPSLARMLQRAELHRLTSVFPSTTTVALTSIYGAATPAEHGLLGHQVFMPELGGIGDMLRYSPRGRSKRDAYLDEGIDSRALFPMETIFQRLKEAGVACTFLSRAEFRRSGLGRLHHPGAKYVGYRHLADFGVMLRRALVDSRAPAFLCGYWDIVDVLSHPYGPRSEEVAAAVDLAFHTLERELFEQTPASARAETLLLVTADHGHIEAPPADAVALGEHPEIVAELLLPPTGGTRAGYLHARPGRAEALREALAPLADRIAIAPTAEAVEAGLWGDPAAARLRTVTLGDFTFQCRAGHTLLPPDRRRDSVRAVSRHGGLSPDEMHVPLLVLPM